MSYCTCDNAGITCAECGGEIPVDALRAENERLTAYVRRLLADDSRVWKCEKCGQEFVTNFNGQWAVADGDATMPCPNCEVGVAHSLSSIHKQEIDRLTAELDQERGRLAGCLCAVESTSKDISPDTWAWSPAYQSVVELRTKYEQVTADLAALQSEIVTKDEKLTIYETDLVEAEKSRGAFKLDNHWLREEIAALRELTRWIPVSEMLPESNKTYEIWAHEFGLGGGLAIAKCFISTAHPTDPHWYFDEVAYRLERPYEVAQTVTHYREIIPPEPPEADDEIL